MHGSVIGRGRAGATHADGRGSLPKSETSSSGWPGRTRSGAPSDPRRDAQPWLRCRPRNGTTVHAPGSAPATVPDLAHFPAEPRTGDLGLRFLHGADGLVQDALR